MVRRVFIVSLSIMMLSFTALALAGGPPVAAAPCAAPCGPYPAKPYTAGPACAYWGDAPFPGLCGGIVALPFLVVGSLLGGNTMGPCGPAFRLHVVRGHIPPKYALREPALLRHADRRLTDLGETVYLAPFLVLNCVGTSRRTRRSNRRPQSVLVGRIETHFLTVWLLI